MMNEISSILPPLPPPVFVHWKVSKVHLFRNGSLGRVVFPFKVHALMDHPWFLQWDWKKHWKLQLGDEISECKYVSQSGCQFMNGITASFRLSFV